MAARQNGIIDRSSRRLAMAIAGALLIGGAACGDTNAAIGASSSSSTQPPTTTTTTALPTSTTTAPATPSATYQTDGYTVKMWDSGMHLVSDVADAPPGSTLVGIGGTISFANETPGHNLSGGVVPSLGIALPGQSCGTNVGAFNSWSWTMANGQPICLLGLTEASLPGSVAAEIPTLSTGQSFTMNLDEPILSRNQATVSGSGVPAGVLMFFAIATGQQWVTAPVVFINRDGTVNTQTTVVIPGS